MINKILLFIYVKTLLFIKLFNELHHTINNNTIRDNLQPVLFLLWYIREDSSQNKLTMSETLGYKWYSCVNFLNFIKKRTLQYFLSKLICLISIAVSRDNACLMSPNNNEIGRMFSRCCSFWSCSELYYLFIMARTS